MGWGDHEFYVGWILVEEDFVEGFICQGWVVSYWKGLNISTVPALILGVTYIHLEPGVWLVGSVLYHQRGSPGGSQGLPHP